MLYAGKDVSMLKHETKPAFYFDAKRGRVVPKKPYKIVSVRTNKWLYDAIVKDATENGECLGRCAFKRLAEYYQNKEGQDAAE